MPHRFLLKRLRRFFVYRVLHVDDTPHRIAMGVAIGVFVAWTPTVGFQMVLCVLLSLLLGANKFVGLPFCWISNPLTIIPVYGPNFIIGSYLLGSKYAWSNFMKAAAAAMTFQGGWVGRIQAWWTATQEIFLPLWLGSLIVAPILAFLTYFTIASIVTTYRRRRQERREHRRVRQAAKV